MEFGHDVDSDVVGRILREISQALADGDIARAEELLCHLTAVASDLPLVHGVKARVLLLCNKPKEALKEARYYVQLSPGSASAHFSLALAAQENNLLSLAQQAFEKAIQLEPKNANYWTDYAMFLALHRAPVLAVNAALKALELDNRDPLNWAALALGQLRMHQYAAANKSAARALRISPNNPIAQWVMLKVLQQQGEHKKADALARVMQDDPVAAQAAEMVMARTRHARLLERVLEKQAEKQSSPELSFTTKLIPLLRIILAGVVVAVIVFGVIKLIDPTSVREAILLVAAGVAALLWLYYR